MNRISILYTPRLILRPFVRGDVGRIGELLADPRVAMQRGLSDFPPASAGGEQFNFAITLAGTRTPGREHDLGDTGHLVGGCHIGACGAEREKCAALGFWMGVPWWNKGFATEAARAVMDFGFARCGYERVVSCHRADNAAVGRVLEKLGFVAQAGTRAAGVWGSLVGIVDYALTREAWTRGRIVYGWRSRARVERVTPCAG